MRNRYNKNWDNWEHFRESKLEKMRAHKANVERRMRGDNDGSRMYWSQRTDKLKRYSRHETLDPSWYTDNIYSNQSIDMDEGAEEDDYFAENEKFDRYFTHNLDYGGGVDGDENMFFERQRGRLAHSDVEFNYPKSRSCCFGGGYDERPKPQLMPKSSSFSVAGRCDRARRSSRERRALENLDNGNNIDGGGYRKYYCWQNGEGDCDKERGVKEIYHIDRDRDIYKKSKNDIMMETQQTNANCVRNIRNIWRRHDHCKNNIINEINGNFIEDFGDYSLDSKKKQRGFNNHQFVEEYLIVHDTAKPTMTERHRDYYVNMKRRDSLDHLYDESVKLLNDEEDEDNSNLLLEELSLSHVPNTRTKSLLEVKPPNRFDDTSSDSTDLDLDDFNFDFEKYWTELDKVTSSAVTSHQYDLDYHNNNVNDCHAHASVSKEKNINVDKYNNGQRIDINLNERSNDDDAGHLMHSYKQNILDLLHSPTHTVRSRYLANKRNENASRNHSTYHGHEDDAYHRSRIGIENAVSSDLATHELYASLDPDLPAINNNRRNINVRGRHQNNPALSLINNIFSIYKPKKYSPVNCRSRTKPEILSKSMNVPSTVRPLGAPYDDFMTSMKRPLTITPPRFNGSRTFSATIDQPYFKIIPEKTGLKISPLYRFGYGDDDSNLRLRCTARPLLFPL